MSETATQTKQEDVTRILPENFTNEQWLEFHKSVGGDLTDPGITPPVEELYTRIMPEIDRVLMGWCDTKPNEKDALVAAEYLAIHLLTRVVRLVCNNPTQYLPVGKEVMQAFNSGFGRMIAARMMGDLLKEMPRD